jgi:7-cyano-7-deazaguanine synthase
MNDALLGLAEIENAASVLAVNKDCGFRVGAFALCFGSPVGGLRAAKSVCDALGLRNRVVSVNCRELGSGDMAGSEANMVAPVSEWWPFRNQLLTTLAGAVALQERMTNLVLGVVASDGCHADGRMGFFEDMRRVLQGQEGKLELEVPAICESTTEASSSTRCSRRVA